jgi:type I restriction enzyme S subunit
MRERNLLSLSYGQIVRRDINSNEGLLPESFETYQIVDRGDIVLRMTDLQNDQRSLRSALVRERGIITSAYIAVRPQSINPCFLDYLMRAYDVQKVFYAMGGGLRQSLKFEELRRLRLVIPSQPEQIGIVRFLDRETTRIDTLIAKKTRFIELLKEKRQAVITKAVTKGLDDSVEMKDSRVKWLGLVPNHWVVAQLSRVTQSRCDGPFGSGLKSHHYTSDGVRVVRLQNIGFAEFKNDNAAFVSYEHWEETLGRGHAVTPGDLLIAGLGDDNNPLGRACTAPEEIGDALVKADCYRFRLDPQKAFSKFFAFLLSATSKAECGFMATGATRDRLNLGLASSRVVAFPPSVEEQKAIVAYIESKVRQINLLLHLEPSAASNSSRNTVPH